jgi:hypothetical protein
MNWPKSLCALWIFSVAMASTLAMPSLPAHADSNPWTQAQTVEPAALAKELENAKTVPVVVFVGFGRLYSAGHIKGAQYHGTTSKEDGLKEFTTWASSLPRTTNLVIYCGCCPMDRCPNIRPAFKALQDLGFKQVRVLLLPSDFATDWAGKGLAYDKGN